MQRKKSGKVRDGEAPSPAREARALPRQLEFVFQRSAIHLRAGHDVDLELKARELLCALGAGKLACEIRVEWNPRLKTCAGRADYREKLISLNPLLLDERVVAPQAVVGQAPRLPILYPASDALALQSEGVDEIDRTLRHELAHLLAQWRIGRRRIAPHGEEWRQACRDLGIADEARCHNLRSQRERTRRATFIVARIAKKNFRASAKFAVRSRV